MLQKPSAILFDWDLTLADNFSALVKAYHHVFAHYNLDLWSEEQIRANTGFSLRESFPRIFGDENWQKAGEIFHAHYAQIHMNETRLLDGALELLRDLKAHYNCPFGVVSNKTPKFLHEEIEAVGIADMIDVVVGAGEASSDKPSPAPVLLAVEKLGLPTGKSIWYVGDTLSDAKAGMGAGCTTLIVAAPDKAIEQENPDVYVASIAELYNLVLDI